jgi:hypothetical protein
MNETGSSTSESRQTQLSGRRFYLRLLLSSGLAAVVGALILFFWGFHVSNPCPCIGFCIFGDPAASGADAHLAGGGAGLGMLLGGIGLLIVSGYLLYRLRTRLRHPFMSLIVGFPVFYSCLLASIWGVARGIWGPTRC